MNFLAHAWLSFNQKEILVGNMISDFVKGKKQFTYSEGIQKGIRLHRNIDTFTDNHEATKQAKQFFKPVVGLYAGAFIDVAYDHFLACDTNEFIDENNLLDFSLTVYKVLDQHLHVLPEKLTRMFPYMKNENWLYNYRTLNGAEKSFSGLIRRAKYLNHTSVVFECFRQNYEPLKKCYQSFFPAVKNFAYHQLSVANGLH
jgi:acyl carrier protein phosphodiesterase